MIINIPSIVVYNTGYLYNLYQYHLNELEHLCNECNIEHIPQYSSYNPTECIAFRSCNNVTLGNYISILDELGNIGYCSSCNGNNIVNVRLQHDHIYFDIDTQ